MTPAGEAGHGPSVPHVLMIGKGWFPDEVGGLDRYFAGLLKELGAAGLVVGPAADAPASVVAVSTHDAPLVRRLLALLGAARRLRGDVVDCHFALYGFAPLLFTRLRRLPLVVHFQGPWADEAPADALIRALKRTLERAVYRRATRCLVLSPAFKRVLVERYGISPWNVAVEPPGVDLVHFTPGDRAAARARLALDADTFVVACVRRLIPRMGVSVLLGAWPQIVSAHEGRAALLVAGDGPLRTELERDVDGSVRFLGRIDDDLLADVYRAADVNVVPSIAHEGFGLVVLEAAACGTPSVVSNVDGLIAAVRDLDPTLVVEKQSPKALAQRLSEPLPGREEARAYAERFAWSGVAARNLAHIEAATTGDSRKLRVVYVDHVARLSGGEIALLRLLPHLSRVEPHVILAEDGPFADALLAEGISVEVLTMSERTRELRKADARPIRFDIAAFFGAVVYSVRLARRLRVLRPDLVHTNSLKAGVCGAFAAALARVPLVWHVRDRIADDYLPRTAVRVIRALVRRYADAVVANSHATLRTLEAPRRSAVAYSVVPEVIEVSDREHPGSDAGATVYGILGRIARWKGQDIFLQAFAQAFPDGDQRAIVVGAPMFGEDEVRFAAELEELAGALGVASRVEFRGFRSDTRAELFEIDVLVHTSKMPEPFGQVVLEGMAAGLPVVAAAAGGPLELITDGLNGLLYPSEDVAVLARLLRELDSDPDRRRRLGVAAQERAREFLPGPTAERVERLYFATIGEAAGG